jgi:hypothetical protein
MPGRYRFPRPSRRLRQTRLEPREQQQNLRVMTCRLTGVLSRRGPVEAVNIASPLHLHKGLSWANEAMLAAVPPVLHSAVLSVGFLWGTPPGPAFVGFLWGRPCAHRGARAAGGVPQNAPNHSMIAITEALLQPAIPSAMSPTRTLIDRLSGTNLHAVLSEQRPYRGSRVR